MSGAASFPSPCPSQTCERRTARDWLASGQERERAGTPDGLTQAVAHYEAALQGATVEGALAALLWMNRGNALVRLASTATVAEAVRSYDAAIRLFESDPDPSSAASLAAAWMNRGLACLHPAQRDSDEGLRSLERARRQFARMNLDLNPAHRCNAAAASLNYCAAVTSDPSQPDRGSAMSAARDALTLAQPLVHQDRSAALISLGAAQHFCTAARPGWSGIAPAAAELRGETSDILDGALAVVRTWEAREPGALREIGQQLFQLSAEFHACYFPQFLAELLQENLDARRAPASWAGNPVIRQIAADAADRAWHTIQNERLRQAGEADPGLAAAARELAALRLNRFVAA